MSMLTKDVCLFLTIALYWQLVACVINKSAEEKCSGMDKQCLLKYYKGLLLPRRDAVKIGHISKLWLESEQFREIKTLSLKPPIFEIPNFLSPEECDDIIRVAKEKGLESSTTMDQNIFEDEKYFTEEQEEVFNYYDHNKDGFMDVDEVVRLFDTELDFSPDKEDVIRMFQDINLDRDGDMLISYKEFMKKDVRGLIEFVSKTKRTKPYTKSRNSNQTWLETNPHSDEVLHSVRRRLHKLTELPMMILNSSESLQVVSYGPRGHYNCHMDSDDIDTKQTCCHFQTLEQDDCRICRYVTVLYFLNDVEEGGETAFPVANNETFDEDLFHKDLERLCNVGRNCHKSNLRVKPEKGKAILWYNHQVDKKTGWLGESDPYSFHGGCDVIKGVKWIANNWISVSENRTKDIEFWIGKQAASSGMVPDMNESNVDDTHLNEDDTQSENIYADDNHEELLNYVKQEDEQKEDKIDSIFNSVHGSADDRHDGRGSVDLDESQRNEL